MNDYDMGTLRNDADYNLFDSFYYKSGLGSRPKMMIKKRGLGRSEFV